MTPGNAIQKSSSDQLSMMGGFTPTNLPQAIAFAEMLGRSGLVPRAIAGKPSDILVVLLTGHEFGLGPMAALRLISVIEGKAVIGGEAYTAVVQASPECERFNCIETTDKKATFEAKKRGDDKVHVLTWTIEQASKAGLLGKDNWKRYPEAMLRWRCASALAKLVFAARFAGVYVPDEEEEIGTPKDAVAPNGEPPDTTDKLAERARAAKAEKGPTGETLDQKAQRLDPMPDASRPGAGERASQATVDVIAEKPKADLRVVGTDDGKRDGSVIKIEVVRELMTGLDEAQIEYQGDRLTMDLGYFEGKTKELSKWRAAQTKAEKLPHQVADEKKAAAAAEGPVMVFGGTDVKGKPISSLDGPKVLEMIALGETKIGTLAEDKKPKVRACIEALKALQKRREAALVTDVPEPGSDLDVD